MDWVRNVTVLMITVRADYGGGPEHVLRLMQTFPEGQVEIFVACPHEEPYWTRFSNVVGLDNMLEIPHRQFTVGHLLKMAWFLFKHNIQLIHSHGKGAGIYGRVLSFLTRKPCVHTFHGIHIDKYSPWQKKIYFVLERTLSRYSKCLIAVSNSEAELAKSVEICDLDKLAIIPNGVCIPHNVFVEAFNTSNGPLQVILMSRFDYQKNSELIIDIIEHLCEIRRVNDFQFVFLGDGEGRKSLEIMVNESGLNRWVVFKGAVSNPEEYLKESFCYLSTSRWEGMPLSILEAMSNAIPVIATDVIGNQDAVEHGRTGYLYALSAPEQAGDFLCKLADDSELWSRLARSAREKAIKEFSVKRMADETLAIYIAAMQRE